MRVSTINDNDNGHVKIVYGNDKFLEIIFTVKRILNDKGEVLTFFAFNIKRKLIYFTAAIAHYLIIIIISLQT